MSKVPCIDKVDNSEAEMFVRFATKPVVFEKKMEMSKIGNAPNVLQNDFEDLAVKRTLIH